MALRKEQIVSQQCYICGTFFQDKVRLGVHIARCYDDAMDRGESWHPHPDILLDEVRYSQYMISGERDKQFKRAEKSRVAYATQDDFANLHSQLTVKRPQQQQQALPSIPPPPPPPAKNVPTSTYQSDFNKQRGGKEPLNSSPIDHIPPGERISTPRSNQSNNNMNTNNNNNFAIAQGRNGGGVGYSLPPPLPPSSSPLSPPKVTFAPPGINTLRSELATELDKVRLFMQDEKRKSAQRDAVLHSLVDGAARNNAHGHDNFNHHNPTTTPASSSPPQINQYYGTANMPPAGRPASSSSSSPRNDFRNPMDGNNQFAPMPKSYNSNASPPPILKSGGGGGGGNSTPRSRGNAGSGAIIIGGESNQKIVAPADDPYVEIMATDIGKAIHGGGFEADPNMRVPCGRCGRQFAPDRVEAHEQVCVSKPSGIHRK
jgi:hypothetical protein